VADQRDADDGDDASVTATVTTAGGRTARLRWTIAAANVRRC